jgi:hypothetical protein
MAAAEEVQEGKEDQEDDHACAERLHPARCPTRCGSVIRGVRRLRQLVHEQ